MLRLLFALIVMGARARHAGLASNGSNLCGTVLAVYIRSESCDNLGDISQEPLREIQL